MKIIVSMYANTLRIRGRLIGKYDFVRIMLA